MKNNKIFIASIIVLSLTFTSLSAYADFDCSSIDRETMKEIKEKEKNWESLTSDEQELLENMEECKPQRGNKDRVKEDWEKPSNRWDKNKTDESRIENMDFYEDLDYYTKEKLSNLEENFKSDMEDLKEEYGDIKELDEEEKEEYIEDQKELKEEYMENLNYILSNNEEALEEIENSMKEKTEKKTNINKKSNTKKIDKESTEKNSLGNKINQTLKKKYKTTLETKYSSVINNFTKEKLENMSEKIDTLMDKIENSNYSDSKKETYMATLDALKDMIKERLEKEKEDNLFDLSELFN